MNNELTTRLLQWYDQNSRDLPWRKDNTFYHVWLSEIMLQQTRVEAVIEYYYRFLEEAPTISTLANLPEERLLKLWEGLGYYQRVRNLQKAAKLLMDIPQNSWPKSKKELLQLPGIGPYTSGAIASICFGERVPAIDGNVLRVISRLHAMQEDLTSKEIHQKITELVTQILPDTRVGDFNQSLMELGATVCIPSANPRCDICPISAFCKAKELNLTDVIPNKKTKTKQTEEDLWVLILKHKELYAIQKRDYTNVLKGLWQFINVKKDKDIQTVISELNLKGKIVKDNIYKKHIFTHKIWHMHMVEIELTELPSIENTVWISLEDMLRMYSLPTAFRQFIPEI